MDREGRIVDCCGYGHHIALTCKNHPNLRWSTKNIDCIGARSIFYVTEDTPECNCSARDLYHVHNEKPFERRTSKPAFIDDVIDPRD